jgi:hypothetical protein
MFVYILSESHQGNKLWTVGHYKPEGATLPNFLPRTPGVFRPTTDATDADFFPESEHDTADEAARRCNYLNGGTGYPYLSLEQAEAMMDNAADVLRRGAGIDDGA